jgi:translation initiation factor IF-2
MEEGKATRGQKVRLLRDGVVVADTTVSSLRRFKDDVREVTAGYECGVGLENFHDIKEGDVLEFYEIREIPRD